MQSIGHIVRRILNAVAYTAAGAVILLALMVGLFRLFLPRLPEYQEDIKAWANEAIGIQVEFSDMNARWRLTGPELNFYGAQLRMPDSEQNLLVAGEVTVGVGLLRLLFDRTLVVDRILVRETEVQLQRLADSTILVQGLPLDDLAALIPESNSSSDVVFVGQDIAVQYREPDEEQALSFEIQQLEATRRDQLLSLEASLGLAEGFGSRLDVTLDQRQLAEVADPVWEVFLEGRTLGLPRWSYLLPAAVSPIESGTGDLSLWAQWTDGAITEATGNILLENFSIAGSARRAPLDVDGRVEFSRSAGGFLISADNFRLRTVDGDWPRSSLQVELSAPAAPETSALDAAASYLKVEDLGYFSGWLPEAWRDTYSNYLPSGEIRDLRVSVSDWQGEDVLFDVNAQLSGAGIRTTESMPGIRNFTGSIRAANSGGRIESNSHDLRLQIPSYIEEPIFLVDALGTIIWRRSGESLTVLSDRLHLSTIDIDSQSSLQVTVASSDQSPVVDFESTWSVDNIAAAKRFLPQPVIHPVLYRWLDSALVSGRFSSGRTRLQGQLDKFPFDAGDGEFRVVATLEDAVMRYADNWPAAEIRSMDVVLDGLRLYTERNSAVAAGNETSDARVEIADLREPVLTIDAFSTGSLETIRRFARNSPIVRVFGDQLDRVSVAGDASFNLLLTYPLKDREDYDFTTRIQVNGGTLSLNGFTPTLSEVYGIVSISRTDLHSESLFGQFLGEPVTLQLSRRQAADGSYNVIGDMAGTMTAAGLINGLNAPLEGIVAGTGDYQAQIRLPRAGAADSLPLLVTATSNLDGFEIGLPAPLDKPADQERELALRIEFPVPDQIVSSATLGDAVRWAGNFRRRDDRWDFDRGALSFGGEYPSEPASRGLHINGHVDEVRLDEWLTLTRGGAGGARVGDRIRTLDVTVGSLFAFGQHFVDHRIDVDRGGNRWFIQAEGAQLQGEITVPYDLDGIQPVTLDMQTLILPGMDAEDAATVAARTSEIDPRTLPPLSIMAEEFALGERALGTVAADFEKTADGLRAAAVTASDDSFEIAGTAGWIVEPGADETPHSYVSAALRSSNVGQTMERLKYDAGIDSSEMQIDANVRWPGAPRQDFLDGLSGSVSVRLGSGQLNEVEPGAGRVFGLMSVIALPRRLSLDFRDVFDKGFGFDEISGTFRIDRGAAFTCDLSLRGPAAEIVIIGSANLADSQYNQTALVSANVGNTLPLVGTVVAGPQVGAALLIFSQIFKKPLQEVGQIYYAIDGTFEEPLVEESDGGRFEAASRQAGCLPEST